MLLATQEDLPEYVLRAIESSEEEDDNEDDLTVPDAPAAVAKDAATPEETPEASEDESDAEDGTSVPSQCHQGTDLDAQDSAQQPAKQACSASGKKDVKVGKAMTYADSFLIFLNTFSPNDYFEIVVKIEPLEANVKEEYFEFDVKIEPLEANVKKEPLE